jgi:hypothetical protein
MNCWYSLCVCVLCCYCTGRGLLSAQVGSSPQLVLVKREAQKELMTQSHGFVFNLQVTLQPICRLHENNTLGSMVYNIQHLDRCQWLTSVIVTTQEAEMRRIAV